MTKLLFVRLFEKEQKLEVAVEDAKGQKRMVTITWLTKELSPLPDTWFDLVEKELQDQDATALAKSKGRVLL